MNDQTWINCSNPPPCTKLLPTSVIYRIKRNDNRVVSRHESRLFVRGNLQNEFEDYAELYAPLSLTDIVRLMLDLPFRFRTTWIKFM